jgi:hypothetical protein
MVPDTFLWYICIFHISIVPRLRLICFHEHLVLSLRLKGKWSIRQRHRFHSTSSYYPSLPVFRIVLHIGIIFTHVYLFPIGEKVKKGLYFTHKYPFLVIHAKGGESISLKQKVRTTTNLKNVVFQIWVKKRFFNQYLIFDIISNWYTLFKINI